MILRAGSILLILLFLSVPTWSQEEIETVYFPIQIIAEKCEISQAGQEQIKDGIYFLYNFFRDKFGLEYDDFELKLRIFGDSNDFKKYEKKISRSISDMGFYSKRLREAVVLVREDESKTIRVAYHESVHYFLHHHIYSLPGWFNEGLAEYCERLKIEGTKVIIPYKPETEIKLKEWLSNGNLIKLNSYLDMPYDEWMAYNKKFPSIGYATGWSLVYFLMSSEEGQNTIRNILYYLRSHKRLKYSSQAINACYPGGVEQLEKDWLDWLMQSKRDHIYSLASK